MSEIIDIKGIAKPALLAGLYNAAKPLGLGYLHYVPGDLSPEFTAAIMEAFEPVGLQFDYLRGRVMKVRLDGDTFDARLYNYDNGEGVAQRVVENLKRRPCGPP